MRKRQKMVVSAMVLGGMVNFSGYWNAMGLTLLTGILYIWSLREGLNGHEWFLIPVPGMVLTLGFALFGMLLPNSIWWSVLYSVILAFSHYFLLLTENIFSVAAIRTIGLYRAAKAVGFVMTIASGFLLSNTVLTFKQDFYVNFAALAIISFVLYVPALWAVQLTDKVSRVVWLVSAFLALYTGILSIPIGFWPIPTTTASIFLTTVMYVFLGISQHMLSERLNKRNTLEYLIFGVVVLVTMLVTTW